MFVYYLELAARSFRRDRALTALMIVAIAFGVGASMTMLTVLHVVSADPIPGHSRDLYYILVDSQRLDSYVPGEEPDFQSTRFDAEAIVRARRADRQAMMSGGNVAIESGRPDLPPFFVSARYTSADFFPMFRAPFAAGAPWTAAEDDGSARVAVITRALAGKLFGPGDAVGRAIRVDGHDLRILGVLDAWQPNPHFWDVSSGRTYGETEQVFVPFSTSRELKLRPEGNMNCWGNEPGPNDNLALDAPCTWIQLWVELDSPDKVAAFHDFLISYSEEQRRAGRFQRPPNVRMRDVLEWLDFRQVVPRDVRLQTWVALGFLLVCLINTVGLLLTKFLRGSPLLGVRRALGASKRSIFAQLLVESGAIGFAGGILGLGVAWLGLFAVRHQPTPYAQLAHLDLPMLGATFGLAIAASLLAGLLPAWRGSQISVASQLKSH
ncbi:MAG: ABC transporter permease [Deltaproteobacteria bacterium]|nr:ABC transporter permease [Deltaproteobacteria bacterium]